MKNEQIIWVRELLKNFSEISAKTELGQNFLILRNSKPIARVIWPWKMIKNHFLEKKINKKNKFDIKKFIWILKIKNKNDFNYKEELQNSIFDKYIK